MKKLLIMLMILGLGAALAYASTDPMPQQVTIISGHTLMLTIPAIVSYPLTAPTESGDEQIAPSPGIPIQTVTLNGNDFTNSGINQAFVTVFMTGTVTNALLSLRGITIDTTGTVTAQPSTPNITLSGVAQKYAKPAGIQSHTYGTVTGNHQVWITKGAGGVSANTYSLVFVWTGYDAGT